MLTRPAMQWEYEERGAWTRMSACYESALNEATMDGGTVSSLTMEVKDDPTKSSFYRFDLVNMTQTRRRDDEDVKWPRKIRLIAVLRGGPVEAVRKP